MGLVLLWGCLAGQRFCAGRKNMPIMGKCKRLLVLLNDVLLIVVGFLLTYFIRFEGSVHLPGRELALLPFVVLIKIVVFHYFKLYGYMLRYATINDLVNICKAAVSATLLFVLYTAFARGFAGFPRSVFVIDMLLTMFFIGGSRFAVRVYKELFVSKKQAQAKRVLILGAGDAGNTLLHEIKSNANLDYTVIGFIDDDEAKANMTINGCPVLGKCDDIVSIVETKKIDEIIIAIPSLYRDRLKSLFEQCAQSGAKIKILPGLEDLINGTVTVNQIQEVRIEDLLGREQVIIDTKGILNYISGKNVLVTGAGGSIGREICRQVMKFSPKSIILLGRGENSIYEVYNELTEHCGTTELIQVVGDIINRKKLEGVFKKYAPQIVFHAGADKHVPLLELNPDEAILNNVIGTKNVIEVSEAAGIAKVVCISTDKAADPVSVMGCAKRIAEKMIMKRKKNAIKETDVIGVRFGNVLGSRGSVIPLFKKQIQHGGPVTVTHPDMMRYFMTIPEAAQLVLQAGSIGTCGDIFLLDMGDSVRIVDLARQMIKLSGFNPGKDISIAYVGLRPGEKLHESLTGKGEILYKTEHPKILRLQMNTEEASIRDEDIEELRLLAINMDSDGIINKLQAVVPNYTPLYSVAGKKTEKKMKWQYTSSAGAMH
jgi:FlaA1/EpsC-like NDP-sugar epimerase